MKSISTTLVRPFSVVAIAALLGFFISTATIVQATITVSNLNDSGPGSLRQAIGDAASGEIITFSATGTITLTSGDLVIDKNLRINGPGASNLTLSGNNSSRVFRISGGNVTISNLTISNGKASGGYGGGISCQGTLTITGCTLKNNTADQGGGAIYNTTFNGGPVVIENSILSGNVAVVFAGGAVCSDGHMTIRSTSIFDNHAPGSSGGGVFCTAGSPMWLSNCTLSGNTAAGIGGGIVGAINSAVDIDSCTVYSNSAANGGGIAYGGGVISIRNSIVAGNSASSPENGPDVYGTITSADYNLIQNPTSNGGGVVGVTTHNIYGQDPKLGPLADLGGPTPTHALRFDSPALDAGSSGGLAKDQRGFTRPIDSPDIANVQGGDGSDIGAYEVNPSTQMAIYTAVEVEFGTTLGRTYRVESSTDMVTWSQVEAGIVGTGGPLTRLYTTRAIPKRFFQAVQE